TRAVFAVCYGARRALHSFPTRRSSDLEQVLRAQTVASLGIGVEPVGLAQHRFGPVEAQPMQIIDDRGGEFGFTALGINVFDAQRSEEHTSELQSRENLVCRLLLEKKKK